MFMASPQLALSLVVGLLLPRPQLATLWLEACFLRCRLLQWVELEH